MSTEYDATVWDEDEMLMPEGGLSAEDLSTDEDDAGFGDDQDPTEPSEVTNGKEPTAPTTEQEEPEAEGNDTDGTPTPELAEEVMPQKLKFNVKIDRKEQNVELDFDELAGIYQKAQNYDRLQRRYGAQTEQLQRLEALSAQLGYESVDDMLSKAHESDRQARIQALVDEGTNEKIAADFVDRDIEKARNARRSEKEDLEDDSVEEKPEETAAKEKRGTPDFKEQVAELFRFRPDLAKELKTLPDEVVAEVVKNNTPLRVAYSEWEAKQLRAENERIRKEKDLFAQQAETASRAPVRGAADRRVDNRETDDPWIAAFREDDY